MSQMRNRERLHRALESIDGPGPGFTGRTLAAARNGVRPSRRFRGLRFPAELALALIVLTIFAALVIGGRLYRIQAPHGQTISHGSHKAVSRSPYEQVVVADWPAVQTAMNSSACRTQILSQNHFGNEEPPLPPDVAECRAKDRLVVQRTQKFLTDLEGVAVPDNFAMADVPLTTSLTVINKETSLALDALDNGRAVDFWAHQNAAAYSFSQEGYQSATLITHG